MQEGEAYEKWYVLLAHINIIYAQTGFFVETSNFAMRGFGYSSNPLGTLAVQIFRGNDAFFRCHVDTYRIFGRLTKNQNPAWFFGSEVRRNLANQNAQIWRSISRRRSFTLFARDRCTRMRTKISKSNNFLYFCCVYFTTHRTFFFSGMRRTALRRLQGMAFKISRKH